MPGMVPRECRTPQEQSSSVAEQVGGCGSWKFAKGQQRKESFPTLGPTASHRAQSRRRTCPQAQPMQRSLQIILGRGKLALTPLKNVYLWLLC